MKINGKGARKSKQGSTLILMVIITDGYFRANRHLHTPGTETTIVPNSKCSLPQACGLQELSKTQHIKKKLLTSTGKTYLAWHYTLGTLREFGRIPESWSHCKITSSAIHAKSRLIQSSNFCMQSCQAHTASGTFKHDHSRNFSG